MTKEEFIKKKVHEMTNNNKVGFDEVSDACAKVINDMFSELIELEFDIDGIMSVVNTLGVFSAKVLHNLFGKKEEET